MKTGTSTPTGFIFAHDESGTGSSTPPEIPVNPVDLGPETKSTASRDNKPEPANIPPTNPPAHSGRIVDFSGAEWLRFDFDLTRPAVYAMLWHNRVVYIGKSTCLARRITNHELRRGEHYDRLVYTLVPARDLDRVERELIQRYKPHFNREHNWGAFKDRVPWPKAKWSDRRLEQRKGATC